MCHSLVATCQDVIFLWGNVIVNVLILVAKVFHILVGERYVVVLINVSSFGCYLTRSFGRGTTLWGCIVNVLVLAAKMCHLSVATCQDVSSFGRGTLCGCIVNVLVLAAKMCHLSVATCQDVSSFDRVIVLIIS